MGAGKTTVGQRVRAPARAAVRRHRRPRHGARGDAGRGDLRRAAARPRFREIEREVVADVCASPEPLVIACGGGAVRRSRESARACARPGSSSGCARPTATLAGRASATARPARCCAAIPPARSRGSSGCASRRTTPRPHACVDTDDLDVDAVADAVLVGVRRSRRRERTRSPVDLGERGYDVVVGDGAIDELGVGARGPAARRDRHPGRRSRRHRRRTSRAALDARGVAHETFLMGDGEDAQDARDRRRSLPRGSRSGDCCAATRSSRSAGESSATPPASRPRSTTAASTSCRCPTTLLAMVDSRDRRQDRREPARGQEPRRRVPPAARGARRSRRARDACPTASTAAASARSRSTR